MELTSPTYFAKEKVQTVQDYVLFCGQAIANLFRKPLYFSDMVQQADAIGVGSLPIVVLTGRRDDAWLAKWSRAEAAVPLPIDPIELADAVVRILRR